MVIAAHTPNPDDPEEKWHPLADHLNKVAHKAAAFAAVIGAERCGHYAGLWHDLGKYNPDFQAYLQACHGGDRTKSVPHAIHGAKLAFDYAEAEDLDILEPLALVIYGHHSGLHAYSDLEDDMAGGDERKTTKAYETALKAARDEQIEIKPEFSSQEFDKLNQFSHCQKELFWRFLFSCLVDADHLDTEKHFHPEKAEQRQNVASLQCLRAVFMAQQEQFVNQLNEPHARLNQIRQEVYDHCIDKAKGEPGVFRLCVPTGGGKTRSGLAFALSHAIQHHRSRVIFAVPYTSIIEQTADVYRAIFAEIKKEVTVLEHHSAVSPDQVGEIFDENARSDYAQARLLAQNWDASLIVTTTVQLFDSLFANRPMRCRKLHNLVNSVIVLDEVQTLPINLLEPILDVLNELVNHYGVTVVLCTATQPAFTGESPYLKGFNQVKDIIPPVQIQEHFQGLQRVDYWIPPEPWSWDDLRVDIHDRHIEQGLIILNTRKDALTVLAQLQGLNLPPDSLFHLSTLLCGAHRSKILKDVKKRLKGRLPCWLVSTQVVEAGVDLDFPVVYRAIAPLDRIVQAAGRCNREGKLDRGQVIIFEPLEGSIPRGDYGTACSLAQGYLKRPDIAAQLHQPEIFEEYFKRLYQSVSDPDSLGRQIQNYRAALNYPKVAELFSLIDTTTIPVVVDYDKSLKILKSIRSRQGLRRGDRAQLQPYIVNLHPDQFKRWQHHCEEVVTGVWQWQGGYDANLTGILLADQPVEYDPFDLMPLAPVSP